jgi:hypothetical protein
MADNLPVFGDPGEVFKAQAAKALGAISDYPAQPFTPMELVQVGWVMATLLKDLWDCYNPNVGEAIHRACNLLPRDKIRMFFVIERSGYPHSPFELADRLKHLSLATVAAEFQMLFHTLGG